MKKSLICISCPLGCSLDVIYEPNKIISVEGATCKRGQIYAEKELFNPERVVTSTVKIIGASIDYLPVKTNSTISKKLMNDVMEKIFKVSVKAPIKIGSVICKNIANSGADLVATRTINVI